MSHWMTLVGTSTVARSPRMGGETSELFNRSALAELGEQDFKYRKT